MTEKIGRALSEDERAELQREAAHAFDERRLDDSQKALDALGSADYSEGLAHLIDGAILNKYLGAPTRPR